MDRPRAFVSSQVSSWLGTVPINRSLSQQIGTLANPATSGVQLRDAGYPTGVYYIKWDGTNTYQIHVNNDLEGGGWMQILNYVHAGGTNPALNVRTNTFPLLGSIYDFADESSSTGATGTWGHINNSLANARNWTEYMFYGKSSGHSRVIHFRGNSSSIVSYIKTGTGNFTQNSATFQTANSFTDPNTNFNGTLRSNSTIPLYCREPTNLMSGFSNQGDLALTEFPMYGESSISGNPRAHWGIHGLGDRWEVDDYPSQQGAGSNYANSTIHRIWVR